MNKKNIKRSLVIITILFLIGSSVETILSQSQNNLIYEKSQKTRDYGYWIQTTNEDFNNGTKYNINVSKDSFFLNQKIKKLRINYNFNLWRIIKYENNTVSSGICPYF